MIRVIVADDHAIFREGLIKMLVSAPAIDVIGNAGSGEEALRLILEEKPDVAVIDISMPGMDGLQMMEHLHRDKLDDTKIIFLTMHNNTSLASKAIRLGAFGYVLKESTFKDLVYAIETVASGRKFISAMVSEELINAPDEGDEKLLFLTTREREVLQLIAAGAKNKEIAGQLFISEKTVNTHKMRIMEKLDLHSVADIVRYAIKAGLI